MAITDADIEQFEADLLAPEKIIRQSDRVVEYLSVEQRLAALEHIQRKRAGNRPRIFYPTQTRRGTE